MTTQQRLIDMNEEVDDQIDKIKQMNRTANQNQEQTNNIMKELGDQGDTIKRQIDLVLIPSNPE